MPYEHESNLMFHSCPMRCKLIYYKVKDTTALREHVLMFIDRVLKYSPRFMFWFNLFNGLSQLKVFITRCFF